MKEVTQFEALKAKNITNRKTKKQFTLCELLSFATNKASLVGQKGDTTETPKGDLSVDASAEPKGSHPSANKKIYAH